MADGAESRDHTLVQIISREQLEVKENIILAKVSDELTGVSSQLAHISESHNTLLKVARMTGLKMAESHYLDDETKAILGKFEQAINTDSFILQKVQKVKFPSILMELQTMIMEQQASKKKVNKRLNSTKRRWKACNLGFSISIILVYIYIVVLVILLPKHAMVINSVALMIKAIADALLELIKLYFDKMEKKFEDKKEAGKIMHENIIHWLHKSQKMIDLTKKLTNNYTCLNEDIKLLLKYEGKVKIKLAMKKVKKVKKKCEVIETKIDCLKDKVNACIREINLGM